MQKQQEKVANPIAEEATRGFIEMVTECRNLRDKHKEELENMRIQMMHNFNSLMENIEENCKWMTRESDEEIAKKWIRNNLEEAQQLIDNIVGIKGITEDPLKVAAELEGVSARADAHGEEMHYGWNVIAANTAGTLQCQFVDDGEEKEKEKEKEKDMSHVSPPQEELFGY